MKYLLSLFLLLLTVSPSAFGIHILHKGTGLDFTTGKITTVYGMIDNSTVDEYQRQISKTSNIPGPRVVLIDSPGGYVDAGNVLISLMEMERSMGIKQVCLVSGGASSMAFNLLTHCDVRLAFRDARMLVHKVEGWGGGRHTAANMRRQADQLDKSDEPFRQANSKAMHLTLRQYDRYADDETDWTPEKLLELHYLDGIVKIK